MECEGSVRRERNVGRGTLGIWGKGRADRGEGLNAREMGGEREQGEGRTGWTG
jgi:hypothetical protein